MTRQRVVEQSLAEQMHDQVSAAAVAFESRWTMRALRRVDADLAQALDEQRHLFHEAILIGEDDEVRQQGEAMCRGWVAAVRRLEDAQEPDDAYQLGQDNRTGLQVAVGPASASAARVRELHGERIIWISPDEVAAMFAGLQGVAHVKALWPGAEITKVIDRYPDEPAQEDA